MSSLSDHAAKPIHVRKQAKQVGKPKPTQAGAVPAAFNQRPVLLRCHYENPDWMLRPLCTLDEKVFSTVCDEYN